MHLSTSLQRTNIFEINMNGVAQMVKKLPESGRPGFNPWVGKTAWRRAWQPTPLFLPGESHGQWSLAGYCPWGGKESDMTEHACSSNKSKIKVEMYRTWTGDSFHI